MDVTVGFGLIAGRDACIIWRGNHERKTSHSEEVNSAGRFDYLKLMLEYERHEVEMVCLAH